MSEDAGFMTAGAYHIMAAYRCPDPASNLRDFIAEKSGGTIQPAEVVIDLFRGRS